MLLITRGIGRRSGRKRFDDFSALGRCAVDDADGFVPSAEQGFGDVGVFLQLACAQEHRFKDFSWDFRRIEDDMSVAGFLNLFDLRVPRVISTSSRRRSR